MPERKRLDLTLGFLKSLDRAAGIEDVRSALIGFLSRFGVEHSFMGTIPVAGTRASQRLGHRVLAAMPEEWGRRYLARAYLFADPTVRHLEVARDPFRWEEARARYAADLRALRIMDEAGEFGMRQGLTIPMLTLDQDLAGASFSGSHFEVGPEDFDTLHLVATYAFAHLLILRDQQDRAASVDLSPREREVLQWVAEGKTATDIGDLLSISDKGVQFHMRQVRQKLGTLNSTQSVAVALRRGLIS